MANSLTGETATCYTYVMRSLLALLQAQPVFAALGVEDVHLVARMAVLRDMQRGETLVVQGKIWQWLFLVAEGELDAVKVSSEGRSLLVTTFKAGDVFWGPAFFLDEAPMAATVEARRPSRVYLWPREQLEPLIVAHSKAGWELCRLMIQRMQRASAVVDELAFQPVTARMARLLLDHFASVGEQAVARSLTLDDMAARVGTTREMVCRVLYRFADMKLINVTRTEFSLTDHDGLLRLGAAEK